MPPFDDFCPGGPIGEANPGAAAGGQLKSPTVNIEIPAETYADLTRHLQKLEEQDREMATIREKLLVAEEQIKKNGRESLRDRGGGAENEAIH